MVKTGVEEFGQGRVRNAEEEGLSLGVERGGDAGGGAGVQGKAALAVAEIIDAQAEEDKKALRDLAETLLAKLKESAPAIGLDISRVTDLEIELGKITVTKGVGVRLQDAEGGTFKTGDISVGDRAGK